MYFERNSYDPSSISEAQSRLQNFQGATSISSSAYFGRDEEEEMDASRGIAGGDGLAGLETAAKDMAQRFLSNPDVQNAAENIRAGALKVSAQFGFDPLCFIGLKLNISISFVLQLSEYLAQFGER
jgi:ADP-ribosylation factor GTPase-activating protein 2/3